MEIEEYRRRGLESIKIGIDRSKRRLGIPLNESRVVHIGPKRTYLSTEKDTQDACGKLLRAKGIFHYRQNSGAGRTERGGFMVYGTPGAPDIIAVIKGRYIGLEIKDVKGKQSENQVAFQEALEKAGGLYLVIRNIDELQEFLEKY